MLNVLIDRMFQRQKTWFASRACTSVEGDVTIVHPAEIQWHARHTPMQLSLEHIILVWTDVWIGPRCRAFPKKAQ